MVFLDRIYTGGGDQGQTSTGSGQRVSKLHPRIVAGGAVDELNCLLGVAAAETPNSPTSKFLHQLQQFLFDLGADLCTPIKDNESTDHCPRITAEHTRKLEQLIDQQVAELNPLTSFVLPGGTQLAAHLHYARAVCRRAEIDVLRLAESEPVNQHLLVSLNRLSDLLFVAARMANDRGHTDVLWQNGSGLS